jgi:hypothetical protein
MTFIFLDLGITKVSSANKRRAITNHLINGKGSRINRSINSKNKLGVEKKEGLM